MSSSARVGDLPSTPKPAAAAADAVDRVGSSATVPPVAKRWVRIRSVFPPLPVA